MFVVGYMIEIQYIKLNFLFSTNLKFGIIHLIILSLILKNYLILLQLFIKKYKLKKITTFFLVVLPVFWGCNNDVNDSVVPADGVRAVLLVQHHSHSQCKYIFKNWNFSFSGNRYNTLRFAFCYRLEWAVYR